MSQPSLFRLVSPYQPTGDQPRAIEALCQGLNDGLSHQTLLGVTGSGKTFTMANVIARTQRPAIILAHNKTLAAQLYGEFKAFFPENAVEYFVSYYDYYQPEAYVPASNTYIEKDLQINEHIEQMRLSATKSLLERQDVVVVATVSSIYGLGAPEVYMKMLLHLSRGEKISEREVLSRLASMQYTRSPSSLERGQYRSRGETIDIFPAENAEHAIRIEFFDGAVESISEFDPLDGAKLKELPRATIYPKSHYAIPKSQVQLTLSAIKDELLERLKFFRESNLLVEAQRLEERTRYDLELLDELGYCKGIENYSRYLSGRAEGEPPPTLFEYLPKDTLVFVDESHVTIPQIGAMYKGDRSRKENLVRYGFRLPSALDNRPLKFHEWESHVGQMIMVSATPSLYEEEHCDHFVEQLVRPTGLVDPKVEIRPVSGQVDDLLSLVRQEVKEGGRVLVTVLTKKLAEKLTEFLTASGVKVAYLHADVDTVERTEILRALRAGIYDVIVGINLLREGLDIPEAGLVCILDADQEGFLRSTRSLIQTIGRVARNVRGRAILYADRMTDSMKAAIEETDRRRSIQETYNQAHHITPQSTKRQNADIMESESYIHSKGKSKAGKSPEGENLQKAREMDFEKRLKLIGELRKKMRKLADAYEYEAAARIRDEIRAIENILD